MTRRICSCRNLSARPNTIRPPPSARGEFMAAGANLHDVPPREQNWPTAIVNSRSGGDNDRLDLACRTNNIKFSPQQTLARDHGRSRPTTCSGRVISSRTLSLAGAHLEACRRRRRRRRPLTTEANCWAYPTTVATHRRHRPTNEWRRRVVGFCLVLTTGRRDAASCDKDSPLDLDKRTERRAEIWAGDTTAAVAFLANEARM